MMSLGRHATLSFVEATWVCDEGVAWNALWQDQVAVPRLVLVSRPEGSLVTEISAEGSSSPRRRGI